MMENNMIEIRIKTPFEEEDLERIFEPFQGYGPLESARLLKGMTLYLAYEYALKNYGTPSLFNLMTLLSGREHSIKNVIQKMASDPLFTKEEFLTNDFNEKCFGCYIVDFGLFAKQMNISPDKIKSLRALRVLIQEENVNMRDPPFMHLLTHAVISNIANFYLRQAPEKLSNDLVGAINLLEYMLKRGIKNVV